MEKNNKNKYNCFHISLEDLLQCIWKCKFQEVLENQTPPMGPSARGTLIKINVKNLTAPLILYQFLSILLIR